LTSIQLLFVAKTQSLKHEKSYHLFRDFIDNINKLNNGLLDLKIKEQTKLFNGFLAFVLGDTLALKWLSGFKEGSNS
jgi:hypothetical protein